MRKRSLFIALAGLALLIAAFALVPQSRPNRITREDFDRIRLRMTLSEVEAIIGPPGDYETGDTTRPDDWVASAEALDVSDLTMAEAEDANREFLCATTAIWECDDAIVVLEIGPTIGVMCKTLGYRRPVNRDPIGVLRWHLRRVWYHYFS
jgi:hypothetical protein